MILLTIMTISMFAAGSGGEDRSPMAIGLTAFLTIIGVIIGGTFGKIVKQLNLKQPTKEEIDKAVESVLNRIGLPPMLSDIIGDVVADVYSKFSGSVAKSMSMSQVATRVLNMPAVEAAQVTKLPLRIVRSSESRSSAVKSMLYKTDAVRAKANSLKISGEIAVQGEPALPPKADLQNEGRKA
jgi:hypothetical protein